jgi:hypothetical protein
MGLYNFKKQFVSKIQIGEKRHTIRAKRARSPKVGETLYLYTGLRQKGAELLMRVPCTKVQDITIAESLGGAAILIDGEPLDRSEKEQLARSDGFENFDEMMRFWNGRLPFSGDIIHWRFQP